MLPAPLKAPLQPVKASARPLAAQAPVPPNQNQLNPLPQPEGDEAADKVSEEHMISQVESHVEIAFGPVASLLIGSGLHLSSMVDECQSTPDPVAAANTPNPATMDLNRSHVTLDGKITSKPVMILGPVNEPGRFPVKIRKTSALPEEDTRPKRAPSVVLSGSPYAIPAIGMSTSPSDRKKKKRITPI